MATALRLWRVFVLPVAKNTTAIHLAAQLYLGLGWSVIPVHNNKVAALEWKPYQTRRPTKDDLQHWFGEQQYSGLAIVTGMISNLVVLDFDDPQLFHQFKTRFFDLTETRNVKTRRGYHLYFQLAPGVCISSHKVPGIDLQSDGRYVVAPPSVIDGHEYKVRHGGQPRILNAKDAKRIKAFLDALATSTQERPVARANRPFEAIDRVSCKNASEPSPSFLISSDITNLYRHLAAKQGRNEALFKVSLRARDSGWDLQQTIAQLADVHATQPAKGKHKTETADQRRKEAEHTIQSAFSRPPRQVEQPIKSEVQQLPNSVRKAFFKRKQTFVVRVVEGLRLKGIQPDEWFTEAQARELLSRVVGKHSIRAALMATSEKIARRDSATGTATPKKTSSIMLIESGIKPDLIRPGRPTYRYRMPSNDELVEKLNVEPHRTSDPLTEDDLQSAKKTRQGAHREFIRRRPGHYPRAWLAARLGVSVSTEKRYNQEIPITATPTYTIQPIFFWNLNKIPDDLDILGLFLQDENSKRYPASQPIALSLLSNGHKVMLVRQGVNYYSYSVQPRAIPDQHFG
jgi:hypothetical protein